MIRTIESGMFDIITLRSDMRALYLGDKAFLWADPEKVGMLELIGNTDQVTYQLSKRAYRLVEVSNEPSYSGVLHLELTYSPHKTQGYLLPSGLPKHPGDKKLIIPTDELIVGTFSIENLVAKLRIFSGNGVRRAKGTT